MLDPSAHVDTFARDRLPPAALWPEMRWEALPELRYPKRLNAATELLDGFRSRGDLVAWVPWRCEDSANPG